MVDHVLVEPDADRFLETIQLRPATEIPDSACGQFRKRLGEGAGRREIVFRQTGSDTASQHAACPA
jgi:hypothetical protein